jgi:hypothetical protein
MARIQRNELLFHSVWLILTLHFVKDKEEEEEEEKKRSEFQTSISRESIRAACKLTFYLFS